MAYFIQQYLEHTKIYESPTSFWKFSAYAAIAAVLRDNIYKKHGDSFLYPNIYTLLLADSAVQRKGKPIELAESLVRNTCTTKIISGRTSIQSVLDELGKNETHKTTGKLIKGGAATFFAPELSAGIVQDPAAVGILTDIYDYKENYKEGLRGRGASEINKIVFTMFAGSNEALLKDVYDLRAIHGGLLGRTFVVKPDEFRPASSLTKQPDTKESFEKLVKLLGDIGNGLKGEVILGNLAAAEYDSWYVPFRESYRTKVDSSGIAGRLHTSILKLAIILAANEMNTVIQKHHIEESINECMALIPNYRTFAIGAGKGNMTAAGGVLIQALVDAPPLYKMSRKQILRVHWQEFDELEMFEKLTMMLGEAGVLKIEVDSKDIIYSLTTKALEDMGIIINNNGSK